MYWTDTGTQEIRRADLDGMNSEQLLSGLSTPLGIALDVAGGKMYWTGTQENSSYFAIYDCGSDCYKDEIGTNIV